MKNFFTFFSLLFMTFSWAADYYWVGGSGKWSEIEHWRTTSGGTSLPSVIPGPTDNVFFDAKSGFTTSSKTVMLDNTVNCHNITFSGSAVAPTLTQSGSQTLNIYGSSEWQTGMGTITVSNIYYRHTGEAKTIKSNGVKTGNNNLYFEEENSLSLLDDFYASATYFYHNAGSWNTNNFRVDINRSFSKNSTKATTLNLGSSQIYLLNTYSEFNTTPLNTTVNAGISHIHFPFLTSANGMNSNGLISRVNQIYYDVTFEGPFGRIVGGAKYNRVVFNGNGLISGNNTFKELILAPTKTYYLVSSNTQTITGLFSADTPQCGGWSAITSFTAGEQANISITAGANVVVSGVIMKDIKITGDKVFTANNSIDNGNNSGWIFPAYVGQNLYWVGGSGNWNDKTHWSQISAGTGGYCVPGPADNTFFDAKSGFTSGSKTVTVDNTSYTHDITFSGNGQAPVLVQSDDQTLNIYGSSEWQIGMGTIDVSNIYYRHTGEAKTIKSNGVKTGKEYLYFEEENSLSLSDDFYASALYFHHNAGTWNTNNFRVDMNRFFYKNSSKATTLNLGSSQLYVLSNYADFDTTPLNTTVNAGTSHIHFPFFTSGKGLSSRTNQIYYDVTYEGSFGIIVGGAKYNRVVFNGNGSISGNNTFKELILAPTKTYSLVSGTTQTITGLFSADTPQCGGWSSITSSTVGEQVNITIAAGANIVVSGVIMKDIKISGDKIFTANNSIDNGNNSGWIFPAYVGQNLYWVGGSGNWNDKAHWSQRSGETGNFCVPGPADDTFFDVNSGFKISNKTITIDNTSYTHDITFLGNGQAPTLTQSGVQTLNIYGSSEWQTGMGTIDVSNIYYRHTGEAKTIKSNGVKTGKEYLYFEEENKLDLSDDFYALAIYFHHNAGTWNTNNFRVDINRSFSKNSTKATVLNLGSSQVYLLNIYPEFNTTPLNTTVNAGTSHFHFPVISDGKGLTTNATQTYYDVTFEGALGRIFGGAKYNRVEFKGDGDLNGSNTFKNLIFSAGKTYNLQNDTTQTIENLTLGGTPCDVTSVKSNITGTKANINLTGDVTNFNFGNLKDINASGKALHFGEQSTIANQNNSSNITYDPYNPGSFEGLGADWIDHVVDPNKPSTYILGTQNFYGNNRTTYKWYKTGGLGSNVTSIISTAKEIDIRKFGYGTYKVVVEYSNGTMVTCSSDDEVYLKGLLRKVIVNPSIRIRVK